MYYWTPWSKCQGLPETLFFHVVLHNMLRAHQGGADRAPIRTNDVAAPQSDQAVFLPNENYKNLSREAKHQQDLLKDYFNHMLTLAGQADRI